MRKRKIFITVMAVILALLMLVPLLASVFSATLAGAVSQSEIDKLEDKATELEKKKKDLAAEIADLKEDQSEMMAKKKLLDDQAELTYQEILNVTAQIETYIILIAEKEVELEDAIEEEAAQIELYKARVRAMEENGSVSYIGVIFSASSFSDLLARMDFISEIMECDKNLSDDLERAKQAVALAKSELEDAKEKQEEAKVVLLNKEEELQGQINEASNIIAALSSNISANSAEYEKAEADRAAVEKEVEDLVAELARQEREAAARGQSSSIVSTGSYSWPSNNSNTVTSPYGMRTNPVSGVYKMHTGIDIGASYGTAVLASDSGTVAVATYNSAYGNYIVINHGSGNTTLYAHMSALYVSKGETVSKGQSIGAVGSTGNSTGPHIHLEITSNGSRVDPLNYFSNYIKGWK